MAKNKYYAVKQGRNVGVFSDWGSCSKQIHGYAGALYKSFNSRAEAEDYLNQPDIVKSENYETENEILNVLNDGEMIAYVDGSNLGDGSAFSWGVVLFSKNIENKKHCIKGKSTDKRFIQYRNVSGELFASVNAIKFAISNNIKKLTIYHDYSGIRHWALGEWKAKNELSLSYKKYIDSIKDKIELEFIKSDGHTGDRFNEEADLLAKEALGIKK